MRFTEEVVLFDFAGIPMVGCLDTGYAIGLTERGAAVCSRMLEEDVPEDDVTAVDPALLEHLARGGFFQRVVAEPRVLSAYLHVTQRCNLACAGCYSLDEHRNRLADAPLADMKCAVEGLAAAGEWHVLRRMLPPFEGKRVLDLGCGFGWHCRYAVEQGAASVVGVDLSERMLAEARAMTDSPAIQYLRMPIEAIDFPADSFDVAISSLAFHYIESFGGLCAKVNRCLSAGGHFVFSVEHPVFTAQGSQELALRRAGGIIVHWPVDSYFSEGVRKAGFLGEEVMKYHKTLTAYVNGLLQNGFELLELSGAATGT